MMPVNIEMVPLRCVMKRGGVTKDGPGNLQVISRPDQFIGKLQ
jgi:hypothetical protein